MAATQQSRQQSEIPAPLVHTRGLAPQRREQGERDDVRQHNRNLGQDAEPEGRAQHDDVAFPLSRIEIQQRVQCTEHARRKQQVEHDRGAEERESQTTRQQPHRDIRTACVHTQTLGQPPRCQQHAQRDDQRLDACDPGVHAEDFPAARDQPEQQRRLVRVPRTIDGRNQPCPELNISQAAVR
jgi:hypothetical protein